MIPPPWVVSPRYHAFGSLLKISRDRLETCPAYPDLGPNYSRLRRDATPD